MKVYHCLSSVGLLGSCLFPLAQLLGRFNNLPYKAALARYGHDRQHLLYRRIHTLGCTWRDAVNLSAVHPRAVLQAVANATGEPQKPLQFVQMTVDHLDPRSLTVYRNAGTENHPCQYARLSPSEDSWCRRVPRVAHDYYHRMAAASKAPLLWAFVPHLLYAGTIPTIGLTIETTGVTNPC